jgi:hypothetical protein
MGDEPKPTDGDTLARIRDLIAEEKALREQLLRRPARSRVTPAEIASLVWLLTRHGISTRSS